MVSFAGCNILLTFTVLIIFVTVLRELDGIVEYFPASSLVANNINSYLSFLFHSILFNCKLSFVYFILICKNYSASGRHGNLLERNCKEYLPTKTLKLILFPLLPLVALINFIATKHLLGITLWSSEKL